MVVRNAARALHWNSIVVEHGSGVARLQKLNHADGIESLRDALVSQDFDHHPRIDVVGAGVPESSVPDLHQTTHDECVVVVVDPYDPTEIVCGEFGGADLHAVCPFLWNRKDGSR